MSVVAKYTHKRGKNKKDYKKENMFTVDSVVEYTIPLNI